MTKKILITEDDASVRDAFKLIFETAGYETDVRATGQTLLTGEFDLPDIFLLDKQLPGSDGLEICRYLKSTERTKDIPVIMISGNPMISRLAIEAGADNFIEKPFRIKGMLEMVNRYTRPKMAQRSM